MKNKLTYQINGFYKFINDKELCGALSDDIIEWFIKEEYSSNYDVRFMRYNKKSVTLKIFSLLKTQEYKDNYHALRIVVDEQDNIDIIFRFYKIESHIDEIINDVILSKKNRRLVRIHNFTV